MGHFPAELNLVLHFPFISLAVPDIFKEKTGFTYQIGDQLFLNLDSVRLYQNTIAGGGGEVGGGVRWGGEGGLGGIANLYSGADL
jgi:hypothetical protein